MGRKKKSAQKKKDARGYVQGPQKEQSSSEAAKKTTTSVSTKTHEDIKKLLGTLEKGAETPNNEKSTIITPSDRFASRLTNVVDRLEELGFSDPQIEQVVTALTYDITLDNALDWLCLYLNTLELPILFTDGRLRNSLSEITTSESLTVLKVPKVKNESSSQPKIDKNMLVTNASLRAKEEKAQAIAADKAVKDTKEKENEEELERKNWLLQQYEYEEDNECENEGDEAGTPEPANPEPDLKPKFATVKLTPEEICLKEEEEKLEEMEADANNDANNYMRSKQEIKHLQIQVKKQRQQVSGLKRRVERQKAKLEQEETQEDAQDVDGEEADEEEEGYGSGLFEIFGNDKEDDEEVPESVSKKNLPSLSPPKVDKLLDYAIPKGWTGTTPQKKLQEVCRKQKLTLPKYTKLPRNGGFRLSVQLKKKGTQQEWHVTTSDFQKGSDLRDYLATQALYAIDPAVPLYQVFPTPFRDLWLSWLQEAEDEKKQVQEQEDNFKQERIDYLMTLISNLQVQYKNEKDDNSKPIYNGKKDATPESNIESVLDDWEDNDDSKSNDGAPLRVSMRRSAIGKKMRYDFLRRQASPLYQIMKESRDKLPMTSYREKVLDMVHNNPVTILCAETGAGKTTQCPQYLLEQALLDGWGDTVQILCTQPRRVAATSVAERVSEEMCDPLGKMVGYQIRMENKRSSQTKLLFCTTGVVLRRLQDDSNLSGTTHVIVDEVHERQQQTDVLLIILRKLLATTRPDLKVILVRIGLNHRMLISY
jgi:ATP-dependent RNA helicase DHX29